MKKTRQRARKSTNKYFHEYLEYESSRMEMSRPQRVPSDNSVIYVRTYPQSENVPVIDLTKSSHSILYNNYKFPSTTSLKVIYKSGSFQNKIPKRLPSLITIPTRTSTQSLGNVNSASNLAKWSRDKLSILDIPPEFFDEDTDGSEYAFHNLSNADLNEEDRNMIECMEGRSETTRGSAYHLEPKQPIENMCQLYGVQSSDNFDWVCIFVEINVGFFRYRVLDILVNDCISPKRFCRI